MWINEICNNDKVVVGMVHLDALPGAVGYDADGGLEKIIANAKADYENLVGGGIDSVIFCNENDKPYSKLVSPQVISAMTSIICNVVGTTPRIPFGVDVQWDAKAAIAIAMATGASFIRGIVCGTFCGDLGFFTPDTEEIIKFRSAIGAQRVKILTNLCPEFSYTLDKRPIDLVAKTTVKSSVVDGLCVSGVMAGTSAHYDDLISVRKAVPSLPIFANTGVTIGNIQDILEIANACVVATCLKVDHNPHNRIDRKNVEKLMAYAKAT